MIKKQHSEQLEDIVDIHEQSITLLDIESMARNTHMVNTHQQANKKDFYASVLLALTHENYSEYQAEVFWHDIVSHLHSLEQILGRHVGISVATVDYLSNIKKILNEPKIIEEEKSDFVSQTSIIDALTQLHLRDVFEMALEKHVDEVTRSHVPLCLLMIDIDDFKRINDDYGHQVGDDVLQRIGGCINGLVREMDLAARYGGEELAVILPNSDTDSAYIAAERIRKAIEQSSFDGFSVTVSIGIGCADHHMNNTSEALIKTADKALYRAKSAGKNITIQ